MTILRAIYAAGVCASVFVLGACGADEPENPYAADFEQARTAATTDFEREVLADDVITDAEFAESRERLYGCLRDLGYEAFAAGDGYTVEVPTGLFAGLSDEEADAKALSDQDSCEAGTTAVIELLHGAIASNPAKEDMEALLVGCLVRHGVREQGYTKEDLNADRESGAFEEDGADSDKFWTCAQDPRT